MSLHPLHLLHTPSGMRFRSEIASSGFLTFLYQLISYFFILARAVRPARLFIAASHAFADASITSVDDPLPM